MSFVDTIVMRALLTETFFPRPAFFVSCAESMQFYFSALSQSNSSPTATTSSLIGDSRTTTCVRHRLSTLRSIANPQSPTVPWVPLSCAALWSALSLMHGRTAVADTTSRHSTRVKGWTGFLLARPLLMNVVTISVS